MERESNQSNQSEQGEGAAGDRPGGGALNPPRFGLRGLFLWVTGLSILFGAMAWAGAIWALMLALAAILIIGHVIAVVIATKLGKRSAKSSKKEPLR